MRARLADPEAEHRNARETVTETYTLEAAKRAVTRAQTRALVFDRLAGTAATMFRGDEVSEPRLLLKLPGAGAFRADVGDILEIERELLHLASTERGKIARLLSLQVRAPAAEIDSTPAVYPPAAPARAGESVQESASARSVARQGASVKAARTT